MRRSLSKHASVNWFRFGVNTRPPKLKSRSTGALDGIVVLYFKKTFFTVGYFLKYSSFFASLRYSMASASGLLVEALSSVSNS